MTAIESLSHATLAASHSAAVRAQDAALDAGRDDLHVAVCELTKIYRVEMRRRTESAADQAALDEINAAFRGVSVADILAERGA